MNKKDISLKLKVLKKLILTVSISNIFNNWSLLQPPDSLGIIVLELNHVLFSINDEILCDPSLKLSNWPY